MGSSIGSLFRLTTFGESHGGGVGGVVDGCPPGLALDVAAIQAELDRRRPGQSSLTTQRKESDRVEVLSGLADGRTLGTPIAFLVRNEDAHSGSYEPFRTLYRPSHADFTYDARYGVRAWAGGGRASARETIGRVAGGAIAR
ncbi:MAG TPA: chorismate synthase, partial [Myxococcota bacterium]|nr:chorismate synthase [Myxococcota bacterium]